jgi:hypothetical protein
VTAQEMPLPVLPRNPPSLMLCSPTSVLFHDATNSYCPRLVTSRARMFTNA